MNSKQPAGLEPYVKLEGLQRQMSVFLVAVGKDPLLLRQGKQALPYLA